MCAREMRPRYTCRSHCTHGAYGSSSRRSPTARATASDSRSRRAVKSTCSARTTRESKQIEVDRDLRRVEAVRVRFGHDHPVRWGRRPFTQFAAQQTHILLDGPRHVLRWRRVPQCVGEHVFVDALAPRQQQQLEHSRGFAPPKSRPRSVWCAVVTTNGPNSDARITKGAKCAMSILRPFARSPLRRSDDARVQRLAPQPPPDRPSSARELTTSLR